MKGSSTLSRFNYHLRVDGRRDQLNETIAQPDGTSVSRAIQYSFDDANRLTSESGTDGKGLAYAKSYTLDEAGNRTHLAASQTNADGSQSATTTNYSYNDLDWLTQQSVIAANSTTNTNYDYDANGSQTGITTQVGVNAPSYVKQVWDFEGHMTARGAVDAQGNWGSSRNQFSYDAGGMRLSQSTVASDGTTSAKTSYLWNGDSLLEERDINGILLARYEHGQELGPLSMLRPATSTVAAQTRYFIEPGKPTQNGQIESFNGRFRAECLDQEWFGSLQDAREMIEEWRVSYNSQRPHSSLGYLPSDKWAQKLLSTTAESYPLIGIPKGSTSDPANYSDPSGRDFSIGSVTTAIATYTVLGAGIGSIANGVANYAVTGTWSLASFQTGALYGGALGPVAAIPGIGFGIAAYGVYSSFDLAQGVWNNPKATTGQRFAAVSLVTTSIIGAFLAARQGVGAFKAARNMWRVASQARAQEEMTLPDDDLVGLPRSIGKLSLGVFEYLESFSAEVDAPSWDAYRHLKGPTQTTASFIDMCILLSTDIQFNLKGMDLNRVLNPDGTPKAVADVRGAPSTDHEFALIANNPALRAKTTFVNEPTNAPAGWEWIKQ